VERRGAEVPGGAIIIKPPLEDNERRGVASSDTGIGVGVNGLPATRPLTDDGGVSDSVAAVGVSKEGMRGTGEEELE
jgi:hypothetical protein